MYCNACGRPVQGGAKSCDHCGVELTAPGAVSNAGEPAGFDAEAYAAVIGPRNVDYHLPRFEAMALGKAKFSWRWSAFFVPVAWLLYRKMWSSAFLVGAFGGI